MRKILIIVIIVLLLTLGYFAVVKGIQIGSFQISSVKQIEEESQKLKSKIEEVNTLIDREYPKKISELKTASNNMEETKSEYLKYTNYSTDAEILAAMQTKSYAIEFLWAKLGTHARKEGINLTFSIVSSSTGASNVNDIDFVVNGSYIAITNFIYAIENDAELNFNIENFKLLPNDGNILQGTFTVRNIAVEGNTSSQITTSTEETTDQNTTTNTETDTTENQENQNNTETNTVAD